jgi:hypothetical protein
MDRKSENRDVGLIWIFSRRPFNLQSQVDNVVRSSCKARNNCYKASIGFDQQEEGMLLRNLSIRIYFHLLVLLLIIRVQCNNPIVGIVSMQKNEADILPYWLEYHSKLFGAENIVILDSFSSGETLKILEEWAKKGLKVLYNQGPYAAKGNLTLQAFHDKLSYADIALPLDGDEFLVGFNNSFPVINKTKILSEMKYFWESNSPCWGMPQYYNAVNLNTSDSMETIQYFSPKQYTVHAAKKLAKLKFLVYLDHGGHTARVYHGTCTSSLDRVGLLHYHFRNPKVTATRALNDVMGFGWLPSNLTLDTVMPYKETLFNLSKIKRAGSHKVRELYNYLRKGTGAFKRKYRPQFIKVGNITEFLRLIDV